jgi:hypothetical protein
MVTAAARVDSISKRVMASWRGFGLPKPRRRCPWDVNAAAAFDSSESEH